MLVVEFSIKGKDRQELAAKFFTRIKDILVQESVQFDFKGGCTTDQ